VAAPVIRLYLGQLTPEAVLAAADDPDAKTKNGQVREANFYSGELVLQRGEKEQAMSLLRWRAVQKISSNMTVPLGNSRRSVHRKISRRRQVLARLRHAVMSAPCRLSGANWTRCAHIELSRS